MFTWHYINIHFGSYFFNDKKLTVRICSITAFEIPFTNIYYNSFMPSSKWFLFMSKDKLLFRRSEDLHALQVPYESVVWHSSKKGNAVLDCILKGMASKNKGSVIHLPSVLVKPHQDPDVQFWIPQLTGRKVSKEEHQGWGLGVHIT